MRINLSAIRKRVEALEQSMGDRGDRVNATDLLSSRDMGVLLIERQYLSDENTPETSMVVARIDELFERHQRACKLYRPKPLSPAEAHEALIEANNRTDEEEERHRHEWLDRLGAPAYIHGKYSETRRE